MRYLLVSMIGLALLGAGATAAGREQAMLSKMTGDERAQLLRALECPAASRDRLLRVKAGTADGAVSESGALMCNLALQALCTASPELNACSRLHRTGAYAGYYLMRYTMPVVAMTRESMQSAGVDASDDAITDAGLESVFTILRFLSPQLQGCSNLPRVRTWCTVTGAAPVAVESHRAAVAYLASEGLRLLAECRARGEQCPISGDRLDKTIVRWFDVLLWDHVLLNGTVLRNSLTQRVRTPPPTAWRLRAMRDSFDPSTRNGPAFRFATDGWWIAVAANILDIDALLDGDRDPRPVALTEPQRKALQTLVTLGVQVLRQRAEPTQLTDFAGRETQGLQFDSGLWDGHEYRRFSAVKSGPRPFSVVVGAQGKPTKVVFANGKERRAENVGLDSGHYRRLTWLYYTLNDVQEDLETDWVQESTLEGLANQFAYAVYWHACHQLRKAGCDGAAPSTSDRVPRFVNYVSGQRGWYRLTPSQPCDAGVPPFGFSTMMTISSNLWWAGFNEDVARIWGRIEAAVNDPHLPAPSAGDTSPCGEDAGTRHWSQTYRQTVRDAKGRITRNGLGFLAMKQWAELALDLP